MILEFFLKNSEQFGNIQKNSQKFGKIQKNSEKFRKNSEKFRKNSEKFGKNRKKRNNSENFGKFIQWKLPSLLWTKIKNGQSSTVLTLE